MTPSITRVLQTTVEKHHAAPTPMRKRRVLVPSPLVTCPEIGVVYNGHAKRNAVQPPFQFRPKEHKRYEKRFLKRQAKKRAQVLKDLEQINAMFPMDILLKALQEQADQVEPPPDPIPIRIKVFPQFRRLKMRKVSKPKKKKRIPESGKLIPPVYKKPKPIHASLWMIGRLLDLPFPLTMAAPLLDIIERRRQSLYQDEGATWYHLFCPGKDEDDPCVEEIFRMFDNNDEGIPEAWFENRENQSALEIYQFRVIAKRFLISQEIDLEERVYLGGVIGMPEDEVSYKFLTLSFKQSLANDKSPEKVRNELFEAYKSSFPADQIQGENLELLTKNYEASVVPLLNEFLPI